MVGYFSPGFLIYTYTLIFIVLFLSIVQKVTKIKLSFFALIYANVIPTCCFNPLAKSENLYVVDFLLCKFWSVIRIDPASPAAGHAVA